MTDARVSRVDSEVLELATAGPRVSRLSTEVLYKLPPTAAQVSRLSTEVLYLPDNSRQSSRVTTEVLMVPGVIGKWTSG